MSKIKSRPKYLRPSDYEDMQKRGETRTCYCCRRTLSIDEFIRPISGRYGFTLMASCEVCRRTGAYRDGGKRKIGAEYKLDRSTRKFVRVRLAEGAEFKDLWRGRAATADYAPFGWQEAIGV